jgi:hypothetical protein
MDNCECEALQVMQQPGQVKETCHFNYLPFPPAFTRRRAVKFSDKITRWLRRRQCADQSASDLEASRTTTSLDWMFACKWRKQTVIRACVG